MQDFRALLAGQVIQFDGGFGTMLGRKGLSAPCLETLVLTHGEAVADIHAQYARAGAQVVETHSLGGNALKLKGHGLSDKTEALAQAAVSLAKASGALVAYSMGTTGDFLYPVGTLTLPQALAAYRRAVRAAAEAGADAVIVETMTDIGEMRAALLAARETGLPVIASYTFEPGGRTMTGGTAACAALAAEALGVAALGINCSAGPEGMPPLLNAMRQVSPLPVIVQPNAGLPFIDPQGKTVFPLSPEAMAPLMAQLIAAGAGGIGGCCGTTPDHIRAMVSLSAAVKPPVPVAAGGPWVSSQRVHLPLSQALTALQSLPPDLDQVFDADPDAPILLDIRGMASEAARELVLQAQQATAQPILFQADDENTLTAVLESYAGKSACHVPRGLAPVLAAYGAAAL